jgi:MFS family permease
MQITGRPLDVGAVALAFTVNGVVVGAWAGAMPALRDRLGISAGTVGLLLVVTGASAIASMQVGGRLSDAVGLRRLVIASLPLMALGTLVLALAPTLALAVVGTVLVGLGNGTMDVAMNALGVQVEQARPRPVMSRLHASWSIGSFTGAAVVALASLATGGVPDDTARVALLVVTAGAVVATAVLAAVTPGGHVVAPHADGVRTAVPRVAYVLAAMAVCFGLTEGTAMDWSSFHVADVLDVDAGTGALGLVSVSAAMVVVRLAGDHLVARFGHVRVVATGAGVATVGFLGTVLVEQAWAVLGAWALVGLGVGMVAPQIYATAGHLGGARVLTRVVTFGYAAFLVGPGVMGALVGSVGVREAMLLPTVLAVALAVLARWMPGVPAAERGSARTHAS